MPQSAADVAAALLERCSTLSVGSPALQVAYPEPTEVFTPPSSGQYLRVDLFLNAPLWQGLADGRLDQGILQIMVVWPKNRGLIDPLAAAEAVRSHFPKGQRLASGVKISRDPVIASPIPESNRVLIPVTIPWVA